MSFAGPSGGQRLRALTVLSFSLAVGACQFEKHAADGGRSESRDSRWWISRARGSVRTVSCLRHRVDRLPSRVPSAEERARVPHGTPRWRKTERECLRPPGTPWPRRLADHL